MTYYAGDTKFTCEVCKIPSSGRHNQKYCSPECRAKVYKLSSEFYNKNIPVGSVGAIQELRVSADLLSKGYEVFRAVSPHAKCDLAVIKNDKFLKYEVTTGYELPSGKIFHSKVGKKGEYPDVIAVVDNKSNIHYINT